MSRSKQEPTSYTYGNLKIEFLNDSDTPVIVTYKIDGETYSGTYHCVWNEGSVDGIDLTESQKNWLAKYEDRADAWYNLKRKLD